MESPPSSTQSGPESQSAKKEGGSVTPELHIQTASEYLPLTGMEMEAVLIYLRMLRSSSPNGSKWILPINLVVPHGEE